MFIYIPKAKKIGVPLFCSLGYPCSRCYHAHLSSSKSIQRIFPTSFISTLLVSHLLLHLISPLLFIRLPSSIGKQFKRAVKQGVSAQLSLCHQFHLLNLMNFAKLIAYLVSALSNYLRTVLLEHILLFPTLPVFELQRDS